MAALGLVILAYIVYLLTYEQSRRLFDEIVERDLENEATSSYARDYYEMFDVLDADEKILNLDLQPENYWEISKSSLIVGDRIQNTYGALAECLRQRTCAPGLRSLSLCRYVRHDRAGYNALINLFHQMGSPVTT